MANTLGQLVVRLGLDAAEFTSGLTKSEYEAKKFAAALDKRIGQAANFAAIGIAAIGTAAVGAVAAVDKLIKKASDYQGLAEKTGADAAAIASLAVAAGASGTELDSIAAASVKLTDGLAKLSDEGKGAGAALQALGLNVRDFKQLDPVAQIESVAKALAEFEDGAEKTAVAVALFGRAGAEMLPFLSDLGGQIGRVNILSAEQIRSADEYAKAQARARTELDLYAQALATEALPAVTALTNAVKDLIKEITGLDGVQKDLKASRDILDWAEGVALAIGTVVEAIAGAVKAARALAGSFEAVWADIKLSAQNANPVTLGKNIITGEFAKQLEERNKTVAEVNQRYVDLWNYNGTAVTDAIRKNFDAQRRLMDPENARESARFDRRAAEMQGPKKKIDTSGLATGGDKDHAGAALRKELEGQIKVIREFAEQQRDAYEFANQYLRGVYDDGLTSLADFFEKQKALREAGLKAQLTAIDQEIAALQALQSNPALKPQERLDAESKIIDAIMRRASVQQRASQSNILAAQDEARAFKQLAYSYYDYLGAVKSLQGDDAGVSALRVAKQTQEAQELLTRVGFDPTAAKEQAEAYGRLLSQTEALGRAQNEYGRLVEAAGVKEQEALLAAQLSGQSEIDTLRQIGAIRQDALGSLGELVVKARELAAALGTPEAALFADKLALQFRQAAAEADPLAQKVRDIGREIGDSFGANVEDALLARGKTLKDRFLGLIEGIGADVQRTLTRNLITKPLSDFLTNVIGGTGAPEGGGLLAGLFGSASKGGGAANTAQEAFRASEIAAQNAATTALTASIGAQNVAYTAATTAVSALTSAASSAAAALSAISMSGGSGGGGLLGSIFGSLSPGNGAFLNEGGFMEYAGSLGFATGGVMLPGSTRRVNERGPELLDVNGKQFLMMGAQRGRVIPTAKAASGDTHINVSVAMPAGGSRETAMQWGSAAGRQIKYATGRNG